MSPASAKFIPVGYHFYLNHVLELLIDVGYSDGEKVLAMMYLAGLISGLFGSGSGVFKVLAMDTTISRLYL